MHWQYINIKVNIKGNFYGIKKNDPRLKHGNGNRNKNQ